jgi:hypothetical protein
LNLTRRQISELESSGAPMPNHYTGRWKGVLFYKGLHWTGPTNLLGCRDRRVRHLEHPTGPHTTALDRTLRAERGLTGTPK